MYIVLLAYRESTVTCKMAGAKWQYGQRQAYRERDSLYPYKVTQPTVATYQPTYPPYLTLPYILERVKRTPPKKERHRQLSYYT